MNQYRHSFNSQPDVAKNRLAVARMYREMRKIYPPAARRYYLACKAYKDQLVAQLDRDLYQSSGTGGSLDGFFDGWPS